jgi:glucose/arabinose dehydrogenase
MALRGSACALAAAIMLAAAAPTASGAPHPGYRVPFDNPFVSTPDAHPEIYLRGMRNPYRWSFDAPTGDMYVADVGGNLREEITYLPRAQIAGANLGWHCFEGTLVQKVCRPPDYVPPAHEYPSSPDVIIGGYVVHDPSLPSLQGRYLYGRYLSGVWTVGPHASGLAANVSTAIEGVTSFGEDGAGHLYATSYDGPLYRLGEAAGALTLTQIGTFVRPTQVLSPPRDSERLFVVEKRGQVKLLSNGRVTDFLDISDRVQDEGYEEGLLGFLPAPDYHASGRVFAFYTDNGGDIQIDEYRRTARDPDRSAASTRRPLLTIQHDQDDHHYGGQMNFGSDGYLYLSTGDGDLKVDPQNDAQRLDSLLGKILRIDVRARRVDRRAPRLRATAVTAQRVLRNRSALAYGRCSERCLLSASGSVRIGKKSYALVGAAAAPRAGRRERLRLRLTPHCAKVLRRARARHRRASVRIVVRAEDATGNSPKAVVRTVSVSG